ncbi:MAG: hypothetical protein KJ620_03500, partial [Candidatus Edwardsbacteria bacterium]|nr:hypothetical protein [Candidatus Edwardsbacteria bacterium]MBU1577703.1 hypothetical protein [Candidatus Edwardsbacteria bacterium]MBU2463866.1 hypothetical protein [Candidatus Edwardsbacteria bacterium]
AQSERKTAVAVMDLRGSGISEMDAKFLTERLMIELQRTDVFDVLERDKMAEILKEQGFQQTGACDQASCLVEVGRLLPVQKMIGGSVGKFGDTYSVQIKLIDLKTAKVEKTATKDFSEKMDYLLTDGMANVANALAQIGFMNKQNKTQQLIEQNKDDLDTTIAKVVKIIKIDDDELLKTIGSKSDRYEWLRKKGKDRIIIDKGFLHSVKKGDKFKIIRTAKKILTKDPITKEVLEKENINNEIATIRAIIVKENITECSIIKLKNDIIVGDKAYKINTENK